ncbi:MAG TPA: FAD-binding protein, partial [bacterium]
MAFLWRKKKRYGSLDEKHRDILVKEFDGKAAFSVSMKGHTSFKIGGPADCMVCPENEEDMIKISAFAKSESLPVTYIGYGTNILVKDGGIRGITVNLKNGFKSIKIDDMDKEILLSVGAGVPVSRLVKLSMEKGWHGIETLA